MKARVPIFSKSEKKKIKSEIKLEIDRIWKEIERLYNDMFDGDYINRIAERKFDKYLNHLPDRIWVE